MQEKRKICRFEWIMYIAAIVTLAVGIFLIISAITYISSYYSSYGMSMSSGWKDAVQYVLSNSGSWFVYALIFFTAGRIIARLEAVKAFGTKDTPAAGKSKAGKGKPDKAASSKDSSSEEAEAEEKAVKAVETPEQKQD